MSNPIFYKGRGTPEMYDDLIDFMNYVFGFDGYNHGFLQILPKLYNPGNDPCYSNYVVTEDGKLKAAIGAFDSELSANGEILKIRGIGNVAVHPRSRSKGYMKDCMGMALRDMIADGVALSVLGGQRQRYQHFGYEQIGQEYAVSVDRGNLRRAFEGEPLRTLEFRKVTAEDGELIDRIHALHESRPMHMVRLREKFFDITRSWGAPVNAVLDSGEFRGYFVDALQELTLIDPDDFTDVVRNYVAQHGEVQMRIAGWDKDSVARAMAFGSVPSLRPCYMANILDYPKVIRTLLRFKASREELADGELSLFIHGFARDVRVHIAVKANEVSVEETDGPCITNGSCKTDGPCKTDGSCEIELDHLEAASFLLGIFSARRLPLSPAVRSWFPLPFYVDNADHV